MDASQLIHQIPDLVNTFAIAAMPTLQAEVTTRGVKLILDKIQSWAKLQFGEKGSVTKSLSTVCTIPDDKQAQERLIQDLQEDSTPEQLQELHSLIEELKPYINIQGNNNFTIAGNVSAPIVKDAILHPYSAIIHGDGNTVNNFPGNVKKNL